MAEIFGKKLISWKLSHDTVRPQRTSLWYFIFIIIFGILIFLAIFTLNFIFAAILIIAVLIIILDRFNEPKYHEFIITDSGVAIDDEFFPWSALDEFMVIYEPPTVNNLYIRKGNYFNQYIKLPLEDLDPVKIRTILLDHLKENVEREEEFLSDKLQRWLRM